MSPTDYTVLSANHAGITVISLDEALKFWQDIVGGKVLYKKQFSEPPYSTIVGIPEAVFDVALIALPGGHAVELLQYSKPEAREVHKPRPCDVGSVHVAFEVKGSADLIREAESLG